MRKEYTKITEIQALSYDICGCSFFMTITYLLFPKYVTRRVKRKYKRYLEYFERISNDLIAEEMIEEINSINITK